MSSKQTQKTTSEQISFGLEDITPALAHAYLAGNKSNRALSIKAVDRYAADMANGQWPLTHQPIALGPNGELVDGQHRLAAIVKANVTVRFFVARYATVEAANAARLRVDLGRVRRVGDMLEIGKFSARGQGKRTASIVAAMYSLETSTLPTVAQTSYRYANERAGVDFAAALGSDFRAPLAGAFAYAYPIAPEQVKEFATMVADKIGYELGSPAHLFVKAMSSTDGLLLTRGGKDERIAVMHRALRLIMCAVTGENVSKLQIGAKGYEFFKAKREAIGL
jgi:hypothetical protein